MSKGLMALVVGAALLPACSGVASVDATTSTSTVIAPDGGLIVPECDDVELGACAAGFVLDDGVFYNLGCGAVRDSAVSDEVIGEGEIEGEMVTVNTLDGMPRTLMVAVSLPGGLCAEGDRVLSDWSMAFPQGVDNEALVEAVCAVGEMTATQREVNDC